MDWKGFLPGKKARGERLREAGVQTAEKPALPALWQNAGCAGLSERRLYDALRNNIPVIDAGLDKLVRLVGGFTVRCSDRGAQEGLSRFLSHVQVNATERGVQSFLSAYFSQLLTYGNAVGEVVCRGGEAVALYNAPLDGVELRGTGPLTLEVRRLEPGGSVPVRYPELVLTSALNPPAGSVKGVSLLNGLPFVSGVLMQVYQSVGQCWERAGNVRFAVTYRPADGATDRAYAKERAQQIASEWSRAMRPGSTSDFVAVGDVNIRAIGADGQVLDSSVPVRQMLEQIVAKMGLPPFLLGLSWSSTERMSSQQADILTSELEGYRRALTPVVEQICEVWLRLRGFRPHVCVDWDDITLQDEAVLANVRLLKARAAEIEEKLKGEIL